MWLIVVLVLLLFFYLYRIDGFDSLKSIGGFKININQSNPDEAYQLLKKIDARVVGFISHLQNKYEPSSGTGLTQGRRNQIDNIPITSLYSGGNIANGVDLSNRKIRDIEYIQERIKQLASNYKPGTLTEINPNNLRGLTAYTENKQDIILCLRSKKTNQLHDLNTMMFVILHEITHMMNKGWGHPEQFWVLFKFVLQEARDYGIYQPINYKYQPIVYCGLNIKHNPIYD